MQKRFSIYLAEDDEDDAELFKDVIFGIIAHTQLFISGDGEKLMDMLFNNAALPDMIFLDLNMPRKNGFECLQEIKSNPLWSAIRTVVLSTTSDVRQIQQCYSLGADGFISKSANYDDFQLNLRHYFI